MAFSSSRSALATAAPASASCSFPLPSLTSASSSVLRSTFWRAEASSSWFWMPCSLKSCRAFSRSACASASWASPLRISSSKGAASKSSSRSPLATIFPSGTMATILAWLLWMREP